MVSSMLTYITSDVHLGLRQCRKDDFMAFLDGLPSGARLVLNGDTITHFYTDANLPEEHKAVVDRIREESLRREVVWIHGNNDKKIAQDLQTYCPQAVRFEKRACLISKRKEYVQRTGYGHRG